MQQYLAKKPKVSSRASTREKVKHTPAPAPDGRDRPKSFVHIPGTLSRNTLRCAYLAPPLQQKNLNSEPSDPVALRSPAKDPE